MPDDLNTIIRKVKMLEQSIDEAKLDRSKLEGELNTLNKRLVEEFELENLEQAQTELKSLKAQCEKIDTEISKRYEEIAGKYSW